MSMAGLLTKMVNTEGEANLRLEEGKIKSSVLRIFVSTLISNIMNFGYHSVVFLSLYCFDIRVILASKNEMGSTPQC